jgi:hypothetical protein
MPAKRPMQKPRLRRYRATKSGKEKRTDQSRRDRERLKARKPPEPEADNEPAKVIIPAHFFRSFLRPARLLRGIQTPATKSLAALLLVRLPAPQGAHQSPPLRDLQRLRSVLVDDGCTQEGHLFVEFWKRIENAWNDGSSPPSRPHPRRSTLPARRPGNCCRKRALLAATRHLIRRPDAPPPAPGKNEAALG